MHPRWLVQFEKSDATIMTNCALEKVPPNTMSILGDPQIDANNCIVKFRNLPKVSSNAMEFRSGEYLDIVDRLWHKYNSQNFAGEIETKLYKGATNDQITGNRLRRHRGYLSQTLAEVVRIFEKRGHTVPYHYQFGCQDSKDNGPAYECKCDLRTMGHISQQDDTQTVWTWLRETSTKSSSIWCRIPATKCTRQKPRSWYTTFAKSLWPHLDSCQTCRPSP